MAPQTTVNSTQSVHSQDSNMSTGKIILSIFNDSRVNIFAMAACRRQHLHIFFLPKRTATHASAIFHFLFRFCI